VNRRDGDPLHVLTLTPFYPSAEDPVGGCFIAETIAPLRRANVTSSVIAARPLHHPHRTELPTYPVDWVRFPQLPGNFGLSSAGRFLYQRLRRRVSRLHGERPFDVIHAHAALPCGHAAALLSRRLRIPLVVTLHGLDVFNAAFQSGVAADWRRKMSCRVYREAAAVVCISRKVETLLQSNVEQPVRTTVIHNGVDEEMFSPLPVGTAVPGICPAVLIVGNLLRGKGHELVLRAVSRLRAPLDAAEVNIIGDGPDRARFQALAVELGLSARVHFMGSKSRLEVADAMRACMVFALPSRPEGLGCVYLEAMACGKPVIACAGQGMDDIIEQGKNGWLVSADGLDELTDALDLLLRSPDLRARIGDAARQTILDRLTLRHQAQRLAAVYASAAS
jgi:teichuronic acid biosynthesis glycosyltransferase TuaC